MSKSHVRPLVASAALVLLAGCVTPPRPARTRDPFAVPSQQLGQSVRAVALAPVRGLNGPREVDGTKGRFTATVEARLREAGFAVIPPSEVGPVFEDVVRWREGFYDPRTGKLDEAKVQGAYEEALERLSDKFGRVDAVAFAAVQVVEARLANDWAAWSGTTQYAGSSGWKRVFFLNRHRGTLKALSFAVDLVDSQGKTVYADDAGLELIQKVDPWGKKVPVDAEALLTDGERNAAAVYGATEALVAGLRAARASGEAPPPGPAGPSGAPVESPAAGPAAPRPAAQEQPAASAPVSG